MLTAPRPYLSVFGDPFSVRGSVFPSGQIRAPSETTPSRPESTLQFVACPHDVKGGDGLVTSFFNHTIVMTPRNGLRLGLYVRVYYRIDPTTVAEFTPPWLLIVLRHIVTYAMMLGNYPNHHDPSILTLVPGPAGEGHFCDFRPSHLQSDATGK